MQLTAMLVDVELTVVVVVAAAAASGVEKQEGSSYYPHPSLQPMD